MRKRKQRRWYVLRVLTVIKLSALGGGADTPPPPPPLYDVCVLKYWITRPHVLSWGTLIMSWKISNDQFDKNRLSNLFHAQFRGISSWTWKKKKQEKKKKTTLGLVDKYAQLLLLFLDYAYFFSKTNRSWVLVRTASMRQSYRVRTFCLENSFTTMGSRENRFYCFISLDWGLTSQLTMFQSCRDVYLGWASNRQSCSTTRPLCRDANPRTCLIWGYLVL